MGGGQRYPGSQGGKDCDTRLCDQLGEEEHCRFEGCAYTSVHSRISLIHVSGPLATPSKLFLKVPGYISQEV